MRRVILLCLAGLLLGVGWYAATHRLPASQDRAAPDDQVRRFPSETGWIQRTFPYFDAAPDAYRTAFLQARALRAAAKTGVFGAWQPVGPTNIGGRISDVAFDPGAPGTLYAAAATGGVFRSADAGETWEPVFDEQPLLSIGAVALDPTAPQTVYVGTGEANGGHNNFAGGGLYKSTDGGASWRFLGLEHTTSIGRIRVDPARPQRVFAAAVGSYFSPNPERGLYRSEDAGDTWERVLFVNDSTGVIDFVMRPDDPDVLLAAAWQRVRRPSGAMLGGPGSGLFRSTDGGDTWTRLGPTNGLPDAEAGRIGLALCRDTPDVMYALYTDGFTYLGLYRTDDGGDTWRDADPDDELRNGFSNFSWYFGQVRVAPDDPDLVFVMDVQLMRSSDGGATWTRQSGTHVDHHALAFHPFDPSFVVNGNDGGLALSQDQGRTWTRVADLPVTQFYEVGLDPSNPNRVYGGTQDNGTLRTLGDNDGWQEILGGDGFYVIVDPTDPTTIYAESQYGGLVKLSGGRTTNATSGIPSGERRNWSTPVVMAPDNPQVLYYGTFRLYRTQDGAASWEAVSDDLTKQLGLPLLGTITTIAVAPSDTRVLYVGTDDGNVWVSDDGAATWRDVTGDLPLRWVTRVVVDPQDEDVAYVTFSGLRWRDPQPHVFRTRDRGRTWQDITSNLPDAPVNAFAVDPRNPAVLYLGSDVGAFTSRDAGATWEPLGTGLPAVSVYDLKIFDDDVQRFLVAGTHGRSMFRLDLSGVPTSLAAGTPPPETTLLEPGYPNPFAAQTTLSYRLSEQATVRLDVFDALGRRVATLFEGTAAPGPHAAVWDASAAAPGTYVARLTVTTPAGRSTHATLLTRVR